MANLLSAATSTLFGKSSPLSAYTIHTGASPAGTPNASSSNLPLAGSSTSPDALAAGELARPFNVGLWRVLSATHKTTGKPASVWTFDKSVISGVRLAGGKEQVLAAMKKEASSLSRLRHPDLLQMIEPLEEGRNDLSFATEYVTGSLESVLKQAEEAASAPGKARATELSIDEVEIQKGVLQLARALAFLHGQAKVVHLNVSPSVVLINSKGDWKLSGLSLTTPLHQPDGTLTKYVYPEFDARLPPQVQWKFDYLAPEYALDSQLATANDLYSVGCLLYAVHLGGKPPFQNRNSMQTLRTNADTELRAGGGSWRSGRRWDQAPQELKDLLPRLLTRTVQQRISLASLPQHPYFSSLAINTLTFLEPTTFASKPREEKATFLKGLLRVLPGFSERLRKRKILPSLLEEMKDVYLLPFLLPNVFEIAKHMTAAEFTPVLARIQPLFAMRDPPQTLLLLLDNMPLMVEKTSAQVFREKVMELVYSSLECDYPPVQEKALKTIPSVCDKLDYGTVQDVVLVKVAILFTKTRILTVKVQTLECFLALVPTLNKSVLTQKLVPLLSKIKTKEPAVMMATLNVHEAMGAKVDRESVAELVLPQLWSMSMGPLLSVDQFQRFMAVIKTLGSRVEREHVEHLRAVRGAEAQTSVSAPISANGGWNHLDEPEVDFATLVKSGGLGPSIASPAPASNGLGDDFWASTADWTSPAAAASSSALTTSMPSLSTQSPPQPTQLTGSTRTTSSSSSRLKARPIPPSNFNAAAFPPTPAPAPPSNGNGWMQNMAAPMQASAAQTHAVMPSSKPNYNLSLAPQQPQAPVMSMTPSMPTPTPQAQPPPWMASSVLQPTKMPQWQASGKASNADWSDFDPLK